jgi:hypothetical protein
MISGKLKSALLLALLPLGFWGVWRLQHNIDVQRAQFENEDEELIVRSGKVIKLLSGEYAPLMADVYWTRAVQYFGNRQYDRNTNLDSLWPLLDITTTLDPNFLPAYRFGGAFLCEPPPRGAGRPDLAVKLIERGIQANPGEWRLYEDLGFVYYFNEKNYLKAAEAFKKGSENPKAKIWMKIMAAKVAGEGESFDTSMSLWQEVYESTTDANLKKNAETHLQLLKAQRDCQLLNSLGDEYEKRFAHRPTRIGELIQAGYLRGTPVDPLGYAYVINTDNKAELNPKSPLVEEQAKINLFR